MKCTDDIRELSNGQNMHVLKRYALSSVLTFFEQTLFSVEWEACLLEDIKKWVRFTLIQPKGKLAVYFYDMPGMTMT